MMKLLHQFQPHVILKDEFIHWFFDDSIIQSLKQDFLYLDSEPENDVQRFQHIAYWYIILREKYGDDVIADAIAAGCKQLLLLGSGYDTRFFRLPALQESQIPTFEVDLPETIHDKRASLMTALGAVPEGLTLIPLDLNQDTLDGLADYGFDQTLPTVYVWQGVSYYLPQASVSQVLDYIALQMRPGSVLIFDCCSPLLTFKNDQVPGVDASIDRLAEIGEPYLFGMDSAEMQAWLQEKGFRQIQIWQQDDLEERVLHRRTLPNTMWYVVVAKVI